jgi:hypothetical protein
VTTNNVSAEMGVLNGAPTFITLVEKAKRPHEVRLELPASWTRAMTGLDAAPDGTANHFQKSVSSTEELDYTEALDFRWHPRRGDGRL